MALALKTLMTHDEILAELQRLGPWFHCIDLGNGIQTKQQTAIGEPVEHPFPTWEKVKACIPKDLSNKTVLDVGCNAGFYSIEMKRRGAARVLGVDSQINLVRQAEFVRDLLLVDIEYRRMSVYDLDHLTMGQFDITLALGLLYHCKHLVLALEKLFAVTRELLIIETAIYPPDRAPESFAYAMGGLQPTLHPLAYVENESDAQEAIYNWFLPSVNALRALLRNVGFSEIQAFPAALGDRIILACHKVRPYPDSRAAGYLGAKLDFLDGPKECKAGDVVKFQIRANNTGVARWLHAGEGDQDRGAVHLVGHLLNDAGSLISWYHAGAYLPQDVAPGESVDIEIALRAPETAGAYAVEFDMVSEHVSWFEDQGALRLRHGIKVT